VGERKIDAKLDGFADDLGFGEFDQRRVNFEAAAFDTGFCPEIGEGLERFDEFRPAIRVAALIDCVHAEKNVASLNYFRPS